jgi:hypothetical protein
MFWDSESVTHVDFLPRGLTINWQYYINLLHNDVQQMNLKEISGKGDHPLLDNAHPHAANLRKVALATIGWDIMNHPPCSLYLSPIDFNFSN